MNAKANFDQASAVPVLPEAVEAMMPFLTEQFGNPLSIHSLGQQPAQALEDARARVAGLVGVKPQTLIFTSSASEANNLAIKGLALANADKGKHVVVSAIEHQSVLRPAHALESLGFSVTELAVDKYGQVDPGRLDKALRPDTVLVSIQHASNEIGTIQHLPELAAVCRRHRVPFHSDGAAAVGRMPVSVPELGVDAYSFAAQSFYGPKGAAALYLGPGLKLAPLIDGGIQERGRRAGTENVPAIVAMGKAAEVARTKVGDWKKQLSSLSTRLLAELPRRLDHVVLTGHPTERLAGHASLCVEFVEGEAMLLFLDDAGFAAASGSACTAKSLKASHTLLAIGLPHAIAQTSLVLTLGKDSTAEQVDRFLDVLPGIVARLRQMSPLYAKLQKGEDPYATRPGDTCDDHHHDEEA